MLLPSLFRNDDFDNFFDMPFTGRENPGLMKTDIVEKDKGFELMIDMPGVKKENVKAELNDGYLTVSVNNEHASDEKDKEGRYIRRERYFGSYSRSFYVGKDITQEDIKAKFENGVLKLDIPKKEELPETKASKFIAIE